MIKTASLNFLNLLLAQFSASSLLVIFDEANRQTAINLKTCAETEFACLTLEIKSLITVDMENFECLINEYDRIIVIYDMNPVISSTSENEKRQLIRHKIHLHFTKISRLCDLSQDFDSFYRLPHNYFVDLHHRIIDAANNIKTINISNSLGTDLTVETKTNFSWVNVNGIKPNKIHGTQAFFFEPMLGEVATHSTICNGIIKFTGSILFSNHTNYKPQLINEPIILKIIDGFIVDLNGKDKNIINYLKDKFSQHEFNRFLSEIGIGTHPAIKLKGQNLIFEERHTGAHIGFGGTKGSDHMDFIFSDSQIKFDEKIIFDGHFQI